MLSDGEESSQAVGLRVSCIAEMVITAARAGDDNSKLYHNISIRVRGHVEAAMDINGVGN